MVTKNKNNYKFVIFYCNPVQYVIYYNHNKGRDPGNKKENEQKMMKSNMTYHARYDRAARIDAILDTVGFGEIMFIVPQSNSREICMTDTGVAIVRAQTDKKIITVYVASLHLARALYEKKFNIDRLPKTLFETVKRNQKYADLINNGISI